MTMKKRLIIIIVVFFLYSISNVLAGERIPSLLVGTWKLINTSKGLPIKMFIKEYKVTFLSDGKWMFKTVLAGKYEGMEMKGSGTWQVKGENLLYTAGDNSGISHIEIKEGILKLNPDPVVMFNGTENVTTAYSKDK